MKRLLFLSAVMLSTTFYAQNKLPEGWDLIILDGKTAYMNMVTGETSYTKPTKPAKTPTITKQVDPTIWHKVKKGETLFAIARKYNISVEDIYSKNTQLNPSKLKVGQEIAVGYDKSKEGKVVYEEVKDMYTNPSNNSQHFVKKGETLYSIARKHGLSVAKLKELNGLTSNEIHIGQKLVLE